MAKIVSMLLLQGETCTGFTTLIESDNPLGIRERCISDYIVRIIR